MFTIFFFGDRMSHSQKNISQEASQKNIISESYIYLNGPYLKYSIESASVSQTIITSKKTTGGDNPFESATVLGYRKGNVENTNRKENGKHLDFLKMNQSITKRKNT